MNITLYTIASSPFCVQAKEYLTAHNLQFEEKDVEFNKDNLNEMLTVSDHFTGVPYIHIVFDYATQAGWRGFTLEEYDQVFQAHVQNQGTVQSNQPSQASDQPQPVATEPVLQTESQQPQEETPDFPVALEQNEPESQPEPTAGMSSDILAASEHATPEPIENQAPDLSHFQADEVHQSAEPAQQGGDVATSVDTLSSQQSTQQSEPQQQLGSIMDNLMQQSNPAPTNQPNQNDVPQEITTQEPPKQMFGVSQSAMPQEQPDTQVQPQNASTVPSVTIPDFPK